MQLAWQTRGGGGDDDEAEVEAEAKGKESEDVQSHLVFWGRFDVLLVVRAPESTQRHCSRWLCKVLLAV